jgi:hypothetical protein
LFAIKISSPIFIVVLYGSYTVFPSFPSEIVITAIGVEGFVVVEEVVLAGELTNVISVLEFRKELAYEANTFDGIITTNTTNSVANITIGVGVRKIFISLIDIYLRLSTILVFRIVDIKYTDMPIIIT